MSSNTTTNIYHYSVSSDYLLYLAVLHCAAATPLTVEGDGPAFPCDPATYSDPALYGEDGLPTWRPLILGHRGAPGMFPEHTARGYREAARQGADIIECDLAITKASHSLRSTDPDTGHCKIKVDIYYE